MRHMTEAEIHSWYTRGEWPCGHGSTYLPGARGGIMRNVRCPACTMALNVCDPESGYNFPIGQVIYEPPGYKPPVMPRPPNIWERVRAVARVIREF